jgi:ABC-type xylose transport system permease subunit
LIACGIAQVMAIWRVASTQSPTSLSVRPIIALSYAGSGSDALLSALSPNAGEGRGIPYSRAAALRLLVFIMPFVTERTVSGECHVKRPTTHVFAKPIQLCTQ